MKIRIADATATQLADFAQTRYGLDVHLRQGKERILAAMQMVGFEGDEIEIEGAPAPIAGQTGHAVPEAQVIDPNRSAANRRMVEIEIMEQDLPGTAFGTEPVPVSVNGRLMYIPRGKRVKIPYEYYEALTNAKTIQYAPAPDEFTPVGEARDVPRFPVTVYGIDPETRAA